MVSGKRLHCGTVLANGTTLVRGTVFCSNMIIQEKMAPLLKDGSPGLTIGRKNQRVGFMKDTARKYLKFDISAVRQCQLQKDIANLRPPLEIKC